MGTARAAITEQGKQRAFSQWTAALWVSWLVEGLLCASHTVESHCTAYILSSKLNNLGQEYNVLFFLNGKETSSELCDLQSQQDSHEAGGADGSTIVSLCFFPSFKAKNSFCMYVHVSSKNAQTTLFLFFSSKRIKNKLPDNQELEEHTHWNQGRSYRPPYRGGAASIQAEKLTVWTLQLDWASVGGQALTQSVHACVFAHTPVRTRAHVVVYGTQGKKGAYCAFYLLVS